MRRTIVVLAVVTALLVTAIPGQASTQYRVGLTGSEEVGGGDPDGFGVAVVTFGQDGRLCFSVRTTNVGPISGAHIHLGDPGVNGPIVVDFDVATNGLAGCVAISDALAGKLLRHPYAYYVNVHSTEYPSGAVRGQLG